MKVTKIAVVGAGFSGAVIAHELAKTGHVIDVYDSRNHVAGNCHTDRDKETNIMVHTYGPHIFHTSNERVWAYINKFGEFNNFINRVKSIYNGKVYSLPINLMTINNFFSKAMSPNEAMNFINSIANRTIIEPRSFEEQALKFIGEDLYNAFFKGYTLKQWGIHPNKLPASILKRLPVRFNYDDNYYESKYQGIPLKGYAYIVEKMLNIENINLYLNTKFEREAANEYNHVFYSGPIDAWFKYCEGRLGYRTLDFKIERYEGDFQGNAVINYGNEEIPYTRITEHKHFTPWEKHNRTIIYKEYSRECQNNDIPYYPIRLINDKNTLKIYLDYAKKEKNVTFVGRLGTYRYLDMDVTIDEALTTVDKYVETISNKEKMPAFIKEPV